MNVASPSDRETTPHHPAPHASDSGNFVLKRWRGRPTVWRDGQPLLMPTYTNSIIGTPERWFAWTDAFIASGVKVYQLDLGRDGGRYGQSSFWTDEGEYPEDAPNGEPLSTEIRAKYILDRVPDAVFAIRPHAYAPQAWMEKNPGELQTDSGGRTYEPSWASQKYLQGLEVFLRKLVSHHEKLSWANRIMGYQVIPVGEGYTMLSIEGGFYDCSPAMHRSWRAWLTHKYGNDAKLREAWSIPDATLDQVAVPSDADLEEKIQSVHHWPAAADMRRERDYVLHHQELLARWVRTIVSSIKSASAPRQVLIGLDVFKQPLIGWQLREEFSHGSSGTASFSMYAASGSIGIGPLLELPGLTNLVTPADYTARHMGCGYEAEGTADSMVLRRKTLLIENDVRTFLVGELPDGRPAKGTFGDLAEVRAGLLRNTALAMSRGLLPYWTDICGAGSWYQDEGIQEEIRRDKKVFESCSAWPHRETEHAIAMIIDDESPLYENFTNGFQQLAVIRQRIEGLALAGIPYRIYLLSDLKHDGFPDYRCYLFPNLFKADGEVCELLKRKIFKDGRISIFGPGTGITDGETVSSQGAEKLLGIPMRLTGQSASRRVRLNGRDLDRLGCTNWPAFYGDSFMYGPILSPEPGKMAAADVQVFGDLVSHWSVHTPGLVMKEHGLGASRNGRVGKRGEGDYAVVFSAAVPMPPPLLRSLAAYGGCHVWCDSDAVVAASDTMVSLHTTKSGPLTLRLPRRAHRIEDAVTGETVAEDASEIQLSISPPETRIFNFE